MKRVALALIALLFAACDTPISSSSIDAGPLDASGLDCDENPCLNGGTCNLLPDGFRCSCPAGFEGQLCETDVDDCEPNPCKNGGFCTDRVAAYQCECAAGYTGVDCSTNVDECADAPCQNGGTCTDMVNGYQCDCSAGYSGSRCEVDVDDCAATPCDNEAECQDEVNGFTCICKAGNTGPTCSNVVETCKEDTCKNGGTCEDGENGFTCACSAGWNGVNCETDIDDCAALPCQNGASCVDKLNGYECECDDGYEGVNCENLIDPCNPSPCQNGGQCTSAGDYYVCSCADGFNGTKCENNIDDCLSNPCANGGTCTDGVDGFSCACTTGYSGPTCNNEPATCPAQNPCGHGTCKDAVNGYMCDCDPGYSGGTCSVDVNDCANDPCGDHGSCTDGVNKYTCACDDGYEGPECQTNIDDCESVPCKNGGECSDLVAGFQCACAPGWGGDTCEGDIDECDPNPCMNNGTCDDPVINEYTCTCAPGWQGNQCEIDECTLVGVCGHGICDGQGGCNCDAGWQGTMCNQNIDECTPSNPCLHGGTCMDSQGSFMCTCTAEYEGVTCDACADGYQDNDNDGICCATGYAGATCLACDDGYESVNGACKMTCNSAPKNCGAHGMCDDSGSEPVCACDPTWVGPLCDSLSGTCTGTPCGANGDCTNTSETTYMCTCDAGFIGRNCEEPDECAAAPCQNGGTCTDGNNTYTCQCASGWLGTNCDEVDNCVTGVPQDGPCSGHGLCTDGNNAYTCACVSGWLGDTCAEPDNCVNNDCARGTCVDGNNTFTCDCAGTGYEGDKCEIKINYCASGPCKNGGQCSDAVTTFACDCAHTGYSGATCEDDIDECADAQADVCEQGTCINGGDGTGYRCRCPDGMIDVDNNGKTCSQVVSVAAGGTNTCAISEVGSLHCWGDNQHGQLAKGTNTNPEQTEIWMPSRIGTGTGWTKVSVGDSHICGVRSGHLFCWGNDTNRQVGGPTAFEEVRPYELRPDLTWIDVSAGAAHTCALATGGALYCWGNSANGQAGTPGSGTTIDSPKQYTGTWTSVSAGGSHTCAINSANELRCWGLSSLTGGTQPIAVPAGNNGQWTSVKAGGTHTCAVAGTKTYCWGTGLEGELGNGGFVDSATPVEVSGQTLGSLATGQNFSCGVVNDADAASTFQIYCWGSNEHSRLLTADTSVNVPQLVTTGASPAWTAYGVGAYHMCAVEAGLLYCWGSNKYGTIGNLLPGGPNVSTPTLLKAPVVLHSVIDHCSPEPCKNGSVCTSSNTGYTCDCTGTGFSGTNCTVETDECATQGICGQGACRDRLDGDGYTCTCPDGLIDLDNTGTTCLNAETIAAGLNHTCVLTESAHTLHCWGSNRYGQFGLGLVGTTSYYPNENSQTVRTPLRLSNIPNGPSNAAGWTHVTVGEGHTCGTLPNALPATGESLYCWGNNAQGQLGRAIVGATGDVSAAPYLLDSGRTWTTLVTGYTHNCGISAGQLYCWGQNTYGQVGNGTLNTPAVFSNTPVALPAGETSWIGVTLGSVHTCGLTSSGTVYCFGRRNNGVLGEGATAGTVSAPVNRINLALPQDFTAISSDNTHTCGKKGSTTYCWGNNSFGGLGYGVTNTPTAVVTPVEVSGSPNYTRIGLGRWFSCGMSPVMGSSPAAYTLACWGDNQKNILLDATKLETNVPTPVSTTRQWRSNLEVGPFHVCGVDSADGKLYCWGDNGAESGVGIGKLGSVAASQTGNFGIAAVKAAAAIHEVQ